MSGVDGVNHRLGRWVHVSKICPRGPTSPPYGVNANVVLSYGEIRKEMSVPLFDGNDDWDGMNPTTTTETTDLFTTTPSTIAPCETPTIAPTPISNDNTIRPLFPNSQKICIKKRFQGFPPGSQLFLVNCNPSHPKTQWIYNEISGEIRAKNFSSFCIQAKTGSNRRVTRETCDGNGLQSFDFVDGVIKVRGSERCLAINPRNKAMLTLRRFWIGLFGFFE